ncbi:MAG: hypothetical protein U0P45_11140 [Acidimicrobiales bacterium]
MPWAAAAIVVVAARHWAERRIADRPRPALPPPTIDADDRVRQLGASQGVGAPATCLVLLLIASAVAPVPFVGPLAAIGLLISAFVRWWQGRSLGLTPDEQAAIGGIRSHLAAWVLGLAAVPLITAVATIAARG